MKKFLLSLFLILLFASTGWSIEPGLINLEESDGSPSIWVYKLVVPPNSLSSAGAIGTFKTVVSATDCSTYVTEGVLCWDTDNDTLYIGDGVTATLIGPGVAGGDITAVWAVTTGNANALTAEAGDSLNATSADSTIPWVVSADCSTHTAEGRACWDSATDTLYAGSGAAVIAVGNPFGAAIDSSEITNATIVDADISATAAIAYSKLAALTATYIIVGNGSNVATAVTMSGDVTIDNAGATTIGADKVALATDTTGNYVATIADAGSGYITVANSGTENAGVTLTIAAGTLVNTLFKVSTDMGDISTDGSSLLQIDSGVVTTTEILDNTITATDLAAALTFAEGDLIDLSAITMSAGVDEGLALPTYADVAPTTEKFYVAYNATDNAIMVREAGGWVNASAGSGAATSLNFVVTAAEGSLSSESVITAGLAIDVTDAGGDGGALTIDFDPTELTGNRTWAAGAAATIAWTWDVSTGTDPIITFGNDIVTFSNSVTIATGKNVTLGTTQWNSGDEIDGTKVKDADLGDVTVDAAGAWTIDSGAIGISEIAASTSAHLFGVLSDETGSGTGALAVFNINPTLVAFTLTGDITSTTPAVDWDLVDNNASALSLDAADKAGILNIITTNSNEGVSFSGFISLGTDPADATTAANILMSNATYIWAENSTPGVDVSVIGVDSGNIVQIAASGSSGVTITPNTTVTGDVTVTGADITLGAAGVKLTGSNGALTILGLGDGYDEDIKIDLNTTTNTGVISSPASSLAAISFSALNLSTTGTLAAGATTLSGDLVLYSINGDPATAGALRYDTTITGMSGGGLRWIDNAGVGVRLILDVDTDPSTDGYIPKYSSSLQKIVWAEDVSAGSPTWDSIGAPTANDEIDMGAYTIELNVSDFEIGDGTAANAVIFTGGANGQFKLGSAGVQFTGDGDGGVTLLGMGNGYDEDLTFNFDDTENEVDITSSTGVTSVDFGAISIKAAGFTATASATPTLTFSDSDASAVGTGDIKVDALTATQDSLLRLYVDDSTGEDTLYVTVDGTNEEILFAKKIDLTSAGIENVGAIADDGAITVISSGSTVTIESVVFTAGAISSATTIEASTSVDISGAAGLILQNDETITNATDGTVTTSGDFEVLGGQITLGSVTGPVSGSITLYGSTSGTTVLSPPAEAGSATAIVLPSTAGTLALTTLVAVDFGLTADADAGDYDILSIDKLEGVDNGVFIDLGADGIALIQSDTNLDLNVGDDGLRLTDGTNQVIVNTGDGMGVTSISFSALNLVTTGTIQAGMVVNSDANGMTGAEMAAVGVRGTLFIATGSATWMLPDAVGGESLCIVDSGTAHDIIVDCEGSNVITLKGTALTANLGITNAAGTSTGDFVCFVATAADNWMTLGMGGTWASQ